MSTINFEKHHGCGNDFILIDGKDLSTDINIPALSTKLCNRNFGIGADGLIIAWPSETQDIRMQIINADGSEPEMCGNGIRCFAKYIYDSGQLSKETFTVETLAGPIIPSLQIENGIVEKVKVDMGEPRLTENPSESIEVGEETFTFTDVSMGNPHAVVFVENIDKLLFEALGPKFAVHPRFPEGINTEFVEILSASEAKMKVWERGAGPTLACGTGACAIGVAGVLTKKLNRNTLIHLPGGDLEINWDEATNHVFMTGPAERVFTGTVPLNQLK